MKKKIPILLVLGFCLFAQSAVSKNVETLAIGSSAPDFNLPGVDGKNYTLQDFKEATVLAVIFTCNHCPTAQSYIGRIQKLYEDYKNKGVVFIAISSNDPAALRPDELAYSYLSDSFDEMKILAQEKHFAFPYLYDGDKQEAASLYGPVATPHVFIFDKERKLRYCGRVDNNQDISKVTTQDTRDALDAVLESKPVKTEITKTFGCSIKWSDKRDRVEKALEAWAKEPVELKELSVDGLKSLLQNKTDKYLLINIWATWCGSCVTEFPEFISIDRIYRNRDFTMVSISMDDMAKKEKALKFLQKQQAAFTNYIFSDSDVYKLFEVIGKKATGAIPLTLFIKPGGEVISVIDGPISPVDLKKIIVGNLQE